MNQFTFLSLIVAVFMLLKANQDKEPKKLTCGEYRISCHSESGYIQILNDSTSLIEVNSNQIYIQSKHKEYFHEKTHIIFFFYDQTADLGRGGMNLKWDNFSHEVPIAKMIVNSQNEYEFFWFGFFNKESKKKEWEKSMDFNISEKRLYPFCLKKCS